jgi:hypothetical protein
VTDGNVRTDKIITVMNNGDRHHFYVRDEPLRDIISTKPRILGTLNQIGRVMKNTLQYTVTGTPMFAPIATLMNYALIQHNAFVRGVKYTPVDAVKGLVESASHRLSDGISQALAKSIAEQSGLARVAPNFAQDLKIRLDNRMRNSIFGLVQREAGNLSTPLQPHELDNRLIDLAKMAAPTIGSDVMSLTTLGRFVSGFTRMMHEAPVLGLIKRQLKESGNLSGGSVRRTVADALDISGDTRRHGYGPASSAFHSWVPWSSAMVQGIGSTAEAFGKAGKDGKYGRIAATVALSTAVPASAVIWNTVIGDEYADYYWSKLTDAQRVNNIYLGVPGLPPEQGILIPLDPLIGVYNAIAIESLNAAFNLSKTRLYGGQLPDSANVSGINGAHFIAALGRYFEVPLPPAAQAAAIMWKKEQFSVKPQLDKDGNFTIFGGHPIQTGTRLDPSTSAARPEGTDPVVEGVARAMFGVAADVVASAYTAGRQGYASGGAKQGFDFAIDATADTLKKQMRYMQPLWSGMMRSNETDELSQTAMIKSKGIENFNKMFQSNVPGMFSLEGGQINRGDTSVVNTDPVFATATRFLKGAQFEKSTYDENMRMLRNEINSIRSTGKWDGKPITYAERNKMIEDKSLQIRALQARFVASVQVIEKQASEAMRQQFGRDFNFTFEGFQPRPNLGTGALLPARR